MNSVDSLAEDSSYPSMAPRLPSLSFASGQNRPAYATSQDEQMLARYPPLLSSHEQTSARLRRLKKTEITNQQVTTGNAEKGQALFSLSDSLSS